jgi:predicted transcriptional regulator YheO
MEQLSKLRRPRLPEELAIHSHIQKTPSMEKRLMTKKKSQEQISILAQAMVLAEGLGKTLAPFCEVVVHDLLDPKNAIALIENNLSGRRIGDPATELGLARIADPSYPQVMANYANQFSDGRQAKSTSIGLKDSSGLYVAAVCLNIDLTMFSAMQGLVAQFTAIDAGKRPKESLDPSGAELIRKKIDAFASRLATTPRALKAEDKRIIVQDLKTSGYLDVRKSMEIAALHLGVSRATAYSYAK